MTGPSLRAMVGVSLALSWIAPARAEAAAPLGIIFSDLESEPGEREVAASLGILVRSMLGPAVRGLVPGRKLALALELLNGGRRRETLTVQPAQARALMDRLTADRTFIGRLDVEATRWQVRGSILGPGGDRIGSVAVQVPPHELNQLASRLAERLAVRLGLRLVERPPMTLDALRPYARAEAAFHRGDARGAARLLENADPRLPASFSTAREMVDSIAASAGVPAPSRMQMSLLSGDNRAARQTAEQILKTAPKDVQARAGKVRALTGLGDMEGALTELAAIQGKSSDPFAAAANVALLVKRRHSRDRAALSRDALSEEEQEVMLATTWKDPEADARPTLAVLSAAGPNALPPELEGLALGAAERVSPNDPGLAAEVATRALKGGVQVDRALPLANVKQLDRAEVALIKERLEGLGASGDKARQSLSQELEKREGVAEKLRLGGLGVQIMDSAIHPLAGQLRELLANFGILQEQVGAQVMVLAKGGSGGSWYLPFRLRRVRFQHGLWRAAWDRPYEVGLISPPPGAEIVAEGLLTEAHLAGLLDQQGGDMALVWSAESKGLQVAVELVLFDGGTGIAYRSSGTVAGLGNSLLALNFIPLVALFGVIIVPAAILRLRRRAGTIVVRLQAKEAADRLFSLTISQSGRPPRIADPEAYAAEMEKLGKKQLKRSARLVDDTTTFERVPPGQWFVHFYGTYRTGKIAHIVSGEEWSQKIEVKPQQVSQVIFSLTPGHAEFHVTVHDKARPQVGVPVWLDEGRDKAVKTNEEGLAVLKVPLGQRLLRVEAGGMLVEKMHVVIKKSALVVAINLDWERKIDDVSRALDNDPEVIAARGTSQLIQLASVKPPEPDNMVSLPDMSLPDEHPRR